MHHSPGKNLCTELNFYRQIQSSVLIGHVLDLVSVTDPLSEPSQSRFRRLDFQLRQAIQINLEIETGILNSVSEALAMNRRYCALDLFLCLFDLIFFFSALIVLHQWKMNISEVSKRIQERTQSWMAIESMTTVMVDTVHQFLPRIRTGWFKSHHPQGIHSVFMAASTLVHSTAIRTGPGGLAEMKEMLEVQSRRWHIAGNTHSLLSPLTMARQLSLLQKNTLRSSKDKNLICAHLTVVNN